jgi:hypothetical protein
MNVPGQGPNALDDLVALMKAVDSNDRRFPATLVYCENWLVRLALRTLDLGIPELAPGVRGGMRWFSEARLTSPFQKRSRSSKLGEGHTHADAVVGDFTIRAGTKSGVALLPTSRTFSIIEAKINSPLASRTTNAAAFDQAARNVACLAEAVRKADVAPQHFDHLGFLVAAPESQIRNCTFGECVTAQSIRDAVVSAAASYGADREKSYQIWIAEWLEPTLAKVRLSCVSWESLINRIQQWNPTYSAGLSDYYDRCLHYN